MTEVLNNLIIMAITKFLDPKNDVAFRRIFGSEKNKDILIHFINDVLEFKDGDKINHFHLRDESLVFATRSRLSS